MFFTAEYSEKTGETEITVTYGGSRFDPADGGDSLSYEMLNNAFDGFSYTYDPDAERSNIVKITIHDNTRSQHEKDQKKTDQKSS